MNNIYVINEVRSNTVYLELNGVRRKLVEQTESKENQADVYYCDCDCDCEVCNNGYHKVEQSEPIDTSEIASNIEQAINDIVEALGCKDTTNVSTYTVDRWAA